MSPGEHSAPAHCCHIVKECELTLADLQFFTRSCEPSFPFFFFFKYVVVKSFDLKFLVTQVFFFFF